MGCGYYVQLAFASSLFHRAVPTRCRSPLNVVVGQPMRYLGGLSFRLLFARVSMTLTEVNRSLLP